MEPLWLAFLLYFFDFANSLVKFHWNCKKLKVKTTDKCVIRSRDKLSKLYRKWSVVDSFVLFATLFYVMVLSSFHPVGFCQILTNLVRFCTILFIFCFQIRCILCGAMAKSRNSLNSHMSRQHRGISIKVV